MRQHWAVEAQLLLKVPVRAYVVRGPPLLPLLKTQPSLKQAEVVGEESDSRTFLLTTWLTDHVPCLFVNNDSSGSVLVLYNSPYGALFFFLLFREGRDKTRRACAYTSKAPSSFLATKPLFNHAVSIVTGSRIKEKHFSGTTVFFLPAETSILIVFFRMPVIFLPAELLGCSIVAEPFYV